MSMMDAIEEEYEDKIEKLQKRIAGLETTIKNACDLINNEGEVNKWKILNRLEPASK